ncbi:MAG: calcium/proton exchanger [Nitrospirae bacterium RBG_16_43_11]|nr:MAG: calcium/proton exchanger [Nitrospirae bacterium RBG_16_43_11]
MLVFVPVSIVLEVMHAGHVWIFIASALAIIPLAGLMGKATEHLSHSLGAGPGGLLNATFGNAAELIIALMAMQKGMYDMVKASIAGSIIGNILLVMGLSVIVGGVKFKKQTFNRTAAGMGATLLTLSAIGLVVPAIFHFVVGSAYVEQEKELSLEIAIVLFVTYILSLVFTLRTHKHLYAGKTAQLEDEALSVSGWSKRKSVLVLLVATGIIAVMSEFLVGSVQHTAAALGLTDIFVGVIVVAIIGNAAEHSTALLVAAKNQMDLAINIAVGSSIQIALFVAPVLVFASHAFGRPMNLLFSTFEVVSIALAVGIVSIISMDGESNWMEGVQLVAVYIILAIAFYFLP